MSYHFTLVFHGFRFTYALIKTSVHFSNHRHNDPSRHKNFLSPMQNCPRFLSRNTHAALSFRTYL